MDFPIVKRTDINRTHEVKFIISKDYLITAQYEEMEAFDRFKKEFEVLVTLGKANKKSTYRNCQVFKFALSVKFLLESIWGAS